MKATTFVKLTLSSIIIIASTTPYFAYKWFEIPVLNFSILIGLLISIAVWDFSNTFPNGKPRPESELERGVVYYVNATVPIHVNSRIIMAGTGSDSPNDCTCWEFTGAGSDATRGLKPGDKFVYIDNPRQYSKKLRDIGATVIFSEKGRKLLIEKPMFLTQRVP